MSYGLAEGRVLSSGRIQFCDVTPNALDQEWSTQWSGSTAVASSSRFASSFGDVGGFDVWVARNSLEQPASLQGKLFSSAGGMFQYPPYRWDLGGNVHLSDERRYVVVNAGNVVTRALDFAAVTGGQSSVFVEDVLGNGTVVIAGVDPLGFVMHYVMDAAGNIMSGRRIGLGWPANGSFRQVLPSTADGSHYVLSCQADSTNRANLVFNSSHQLERVVGDVGGDLVFGRALSGSSVQWNSGLFLGSVSSWRPMRITLSLPGQGPSSANFGLRRFGSVHVGAWPNNVGGTSMVAIGLGGVIKWARSYDCDCWEMPSNMEGAVLVTRSQYSGLGSTRYLRLDPQTGDVLSAYEVAHGLQSVLGYQGDVAGFSSSQAAVTLLGNGSQSVVVVQSGATALPTAWPLQQFFGAAFASIGYDGSLVSIQAASGTGMWISANAASRAVPTLSCVQPIPVSAFAVHASDISASTQVAFDADIAFVANGATSLPSFSVQSADISQACVLVDVEPVGPCLPSVAARQGAPATGSTEVREREPRSHERRKQKSRR